jgi:hypothetical protein
MKAQIQHGAVNLLLTLGLILGITQCSKGSGWDDSLAPDNASLKSTASTSSLSESEIRAILFMREEEKLARDVYLHLYEVYPLRPFLHISKSEQAHMDAIRYLIDTYGLEDPVGENPEGVFQNQELQQLYNELVETGSKSREDALKVGALIEEVDIIDLQGHLEAEITNSDVERVFTNLCSASGRHLKAFVGILKLYNVEYVPVELDQQEFDRILSE